MRSAQEIIANNLNRAITEIFRNLTEKGKYTTGKTANSLEVRNVSAMGGQIWGWEYYQVWETGRKPGKMPPVNPLIEWARLKLGLAGKEATSAGWSMAKGIALRGTTLYQQGGRKDIFTPVFASLADRIAEQLGQYYVEIFKGK